MRLTGADTFNDTGCWQAAALTNVRSFQAVRSTGVPPFKLLCLFIGGTLQRTSLYSVFLRTSRPEASSPTGGPTVGLYAIDRPGS